MLKLDVDLDEEVVVGPFVFVPSRPDRVVELDDEGVVVHWLPRGVAPLDFVREEMSLREGPAVVSA